MPRSPSDHQPATGRGDGRACAQGRVTARDTAREALARVIWETSRADEGTISATGADIVADALLASPAMDVVLAERVMALAEYGTFVHDVAQRTSLEPFEHMFAIRARARSVLRALAAVLAERSQS